MPRYNSWHFSFIHIRCFKLDIVNAQVLVFYLNILFGVIRFDLNIFDWVLNFKICFGRRIIKLTFSRKAFWRFISVPRILWILWLLFGGVIRSHVLIQKLLVFASCFPTAIWCFYFFGINHFWLLASCSYSSGSWTYSTG